SVLSFLAVAVGSVVFIDAFAAIVHVHGRLQEQKRVSGTARFRIVQNRGRVFSDPDEYRPPPPFAYEDVRDLKSSLPWLYMVSPEGTGGRNSFEYGGRRVFTRISGVTPEWTKRDFVYRLRGRFLDWNDVEDKRRVCVVIRKAPPAPPSSSKRRRVKEWNPMVPFDVLVSHSDLLGRTVKLNDITFTVVGVLDELPASRRPQLLTGSGRARVLAPVTTLAHYNFIRGSSSLEVTVDAGGEKDADKAMKYVRNFLKVRFGDEEYFLIENQMSMLQEILRKSVKDSLINISLGMLAFIAGGIGIMNVTLATVFSRVKEIGVRRALGASRGDIMLQFMVEAVMLGFIGGALGSSAGYVWGVPIKVMLGLDPSPIRLWMPAVSVIIATVTAFLFSVYPAWVAAGMRPAEALRTE
ncbi:MAG TPA: ABC transporter permease, partial [Elusimicrobiales bacterium]|nr:ABC transporter permease [Elusimicrobiales bacterium]